MRRKRLGGIVAPVAAEVRGYVTSIDAVVSPITKTRAALVQYYVFVPARFERRAGRGEHDRLVERGLWGWPLVIDTEDGALWVPLENLTAYFAGANTGEQPLLEPLPDGLKHLRLESEISERLREGSLYYREMILRSGERVRIRGTIGAMEVGGAYRTTASVSYVLRGDLEPAILAPDVPELA